MDTATKETRFLYPQSRQYPFDEVCERIVRALAERNWRVPGITVIDDSTYVGGQECTVVREIIGHDFKLRFYRRQSDHNDAAVADIAIPKKEIRVFADELGPTLYVYVGSNWCKDRVGFIHESKKSSKLNGKRRTYLMYRGRSDRKGQRPELLLHDNDEGREHDRDRYDPVAYNTELIFKEFKNWLEENVLSRILLQPPASRR